MSELSMSEEAEDCPYCKEPAGSACVVAYSRRAGLHRPRALYPHAARIDLWAASLTTRVRAAQGAAPTIQKEEDR